MARPVVDFPQPLSPTNPKRLTLLDVKETPSTALTAPTWRLMMKPL
jgi:hypothetical protein